MVDESRDAAFGGEAGKEAMIMAISLAVTPKTPAHAGTRPNRWRAADPQGRIVLHQVDEVDEKYGEPAQLLGLLG